MRSEGVLRKKKVFIRNDKSDLVIRQKWIKNETKRLYNGITSNMKPNNKVYTTLKSQFLDNIQDDQVNYQTNWFKTLTTEKGKWNFINEVRNEKRTKTEIRSLRNCFDDIVTDEKKVANLLNYRFSKLGDYLGETKIYPKSNEVLCQKKFQFQPISLFQCKKLIKNININKPLGPSSIPAWALKDCLNVIAEPLCFMINSFLDLGEFPNHLKQAFVVPIYKKGDIEEPKNYRPISITSALSKIFETVLKDQIVEFLNKNNLLSYSQFGFRSHFSSADALLFATETIRKQIDEKNIVAAAFLDLSKEFDSISHCILFEKLRELNFEDKAISVIKNYITGRIQKVTLDSCNSDWIELYQGVPQGTVLGPLLFNIYVNIMKQIISNQCKLVQYADDTMILCSDKDENHALNKLEKDIEQLIHFFENHRLTINADKTEFILFCKPSKNNDVKSYKLHVKDQIIKHSNSVKYLGIFLDQNLTFQDEVKSILQKMSCGIKCLYSLRDLFPEKTRLMLLNALVVSHLQYSAILLTGITENLMTTLEKQLNWAIKACFFSH